jgi:2-polyprenyl-6-methoxyphenol hydroxylase-like FAD-dependent oxidoreductase
MRNSGSTQRSAVVIGGSVAGLFVGNMLLRRGWHVDIFERVTETLASRGAGIAWHEEEVGAVMAAAGASDASPLGIAHEGRYAYDEHGNEIVFYRYPQFMASWARAYDPLRAAFPDANYHPGAELVGIDRDRRRPVARFADGRQIQADLIVGADGFRSTVRALMAPETELQYAGYVGWRGLIEEAELSETFRTEMFEKFILCFAPASQFIGYPVPGHGHSVEVGRRRYNFLWYYPVDAGAPLADLLTDDSGELHDHSIPPPLIRKSHIEAIKRKAAELLPPHFAYVMATNTRYMLQPIYDALPERISFGNVALIGDAAVVARPHVGIGVLKAGEDALELADRLGDSATIEEALARYESARLPDGRAAVQFGRHLGAFIERRLHGPTSDASLNLTPETITRISGRPKAWTLL